MVEAPRLVTSPETGGYGLSWCSVSVTDGGRLVRPLSIGRARPRGALRCRAAMPQGYSWVPTLPTGDGERGKRPGGARRPARVGAGAPSAVAAGAWRSRRQYSEAGKAGHMGKGASERAARLRRKEVAGEHRRAGSPSLDEARERVLHFQRKLHEWASDDAERRFHDLWNLVCDPATLLVAWSRVSQNRGSRTAGIDAFTRHHVEQRTAWSGSLRELRGELKTGTLPAAAGARAADPQARRQHAPPGDPDAQGSGRPDGPQARAGADLRVRLLSVELRLPAGPPGTGRDRRDRPLHARPLGLRVGDRGGHRGVLRPPRPLPSYGRGRAACRGQARPRLVRVVPASRGDAGDGRLERTVTGTPQGGIASPLLANIALSALDRRYAGGLAEMSRYARLTAKYLRPRGLPTYRLVRFADDLVVLVKGTREQAEAVLGGLSERVASIGLRLKPEKTGAHPHRRGLHVPRPADHPPAEGTQALRLHLRLRRGAGLDQAQGQGPHRAVHDATWSSPTCCAR